PPAPIRAASDTSPDARTVQTASGTSDDRPTVRVPLGRIAGARSGDKGGNANLGVWTTTAARYDWLAAHLTADTLKELLPDLADHHIDRYELPNLKALNFVVHGLLGRGVAASPRLDPQAKALGEELRACLVDLPADLYG
ncbi:AtuA-related protein, partial [Nonomuraea zeae]